MSVRSRAALLSLACAGLLGPLAVALPAVATHDGSGPHARATDDSCPAGEVPRAPFSDVPRDDAHRGGIDCVVWWGVASGRGGREYAPGADVSRGQMATFLRNLVVESGGTLPAPTRDHFSDDDGTRHEQSINALAEAGIVAGRGEGRYAPEAQVERGAMATFLVNAYEHRAERELTATDDAFTDDQGGRHETSTNQAAAAGFAAGVGGRSYAPERVVHRDAMASFLARVLDLLVEDGLATPPEAGAGDVDPGFGDGGFTAVDFGAGYAEARAAALGPDGTLVVAGTAEGHVAVTRLRADGALDTSFGDQGRVVTPVLDSTTSRAEAVAVQPDGKVVVAGWAVHATSSGSAEHYVVARYLADGALDPGFSGDGVLSVGAGGRRARALEVVVRPDGRVVVGAQRFTQDDGAGPLPPYADHDFFVFSLLPDGSPDPELSNGRGSFHYGRQGDDFLDGMALQPDGLVVVVGLSRRVQQGYDAEVGIGRFAPDSSGAGLAITDTADHLVRVGAVALQSDGAVITTGGHRPGPDAPTSIALTRHDSSLAFDRSFGDQGLLLASPAPQSVGNAVAVDGNDRIAVAGTGRAADGSGASWVVTRHTRDGAVDEAFGERGAVRTSIGTVANAVVLQGSDVVVAGCDVCAGAPEDRSTPQGSSRFVVARLLGEAPRR